MVSELFVKYGKQLVESGKVAQSQIDAACRRVLEAKYKLGLFSDPYRFIDEKRNATELMSQDKLSLWKDAAVESFVLLKNAGHVLPLKTTQKVAFIGPLVQDKRELIGNWSGAGDWKKAVSIWDALGTKFNGKTFLYSKGCNLVDDPSLLEKLNLDHAGLTVDPKKPDVLISEAVETARKADVIVAVLGEPASMSGEAACRSQIGLFDNQQQLLRALKATGKPIVLVLMNGRPLTLPWENENVDAILETWYGGTMAGPAIVETLYGDANPSGKLTMSFPINVGQIPIYYNEKSTGRPFDDKEKYRSKYLDVSNDPLYPFGWGLSYSKFSFSDVQITPPSMKKNGRITVWLDVTNDGDRAGTEVVQLYTRQLVGSITRPVKELKDFERVFLNPGQTQRVAFDLTADKLKFWNSQLEYAAESGQFEVMVGPNSKETKQVSFMLSDR